MIKFNAERLAGGSIKEMRAVSISTDRSKLRVGAERDGVEALAVSDEFADGQAIVCVP